MTDEITLKFDFKLISKDNEKIRGKHGKVFLSDKYKNFERSIKLAAHNQIKKSDFEPFEPDAQLNMKIFAYFKTKVHADLWNLPKSLSDALEEIIYPNDRQIKSGEIIVTENWERDAFTVYVTKIP